jgi:hypothetical protein
MAFLLLASRCFNFIVSQQPMSSVFQEHLHKQVYLLVNLFDLKAYAPSSFLSPTCFSTLTTRVVRLTLRSSLACCLPPQIWSSLKERKRRLRSFGEILFCFVFGWHGEGWIFGRKVSLEVERRVFDDAFGDY